MASRRRPSRRRGHLGSSAHTPWHRTSVPVSTRDSRYPLLRRVNLHFRAFEDRDYERLAEIGAAIQPHTSSTAQSLRYRDATLEPRVRMVRMVAETETNMVVGAGQLMHIWSAYHPRRY